MTSINFKIIPSLCRFDIFANKPEHFPNDNMPEVAFVGRSNVGKSSLLNALMSRNNLAITSKSPGRTRSINFYNICDLCRFVDLPGYGYARGDLSEKQSWKYLIEDYFFQREELMMVYLLIDGRYEPKKLDFEMSDFLLQSDINFSCIITKIDKSSQDSIYKNKQILETQMGPKNIFFASSHKKHNIDVINRHIGESICLQ